MKTSNTLNALFHFIDAVNKRSRGVICSVRYHTEEVKMKFRLQKEGSEKFSHFIFYQQHLN